ncbi:MAG TPA: CoA ester lyase [Acidimicrobiales bacterium]|nr:CoA ester lyase [Acidimicrobiales bacterium]
MSATLPRSYLFVPGNRPERFEKAHAAGADAVILDLEDAVQPDEKPLAREAVLSAVSTHAVRPAWVRINSPDTTWFGDDVAALVGMAGVAGIVLPKAESPTQIAEVVARLGRDVAVFALVESARGVRDAAAIAGSEHVDRIMFGNLDFSLDSGISVRSEDERELLFARSAIVVASRAARLPGPIDGVQPEIDNDPLTTASTRRAADLGFTGKLCLHPRQVAVVEEAFAPSDDEVEWATRVVDQAGSSEGAAVRVDGAMIDQPRLELARRILHRVEPTRPASSP